MGDLHLRLERSNGRAGWTARRLARFLLSSTILGMSCVASLPTPVRAEPTAAEQPVALAIPAQPLAPAMDAFSRATGWQVGYSAALARKVATRPVNGTLAPSAALRVMLDGTAIRVRVTGPTSVALIDVADEAKAAAGDDATVLLDTVDVQGRVSPIGPDGSIVAKSSATASKTDTPILDAPASVSVVTEKELETRGVTKLDQALAYSSSVMADTYGSDDRYDWYYLRGFYQTGNGSYRDGLPMRIAGFTGAKAEPYGMQRIEVLKGSTSVLYGLNAPGGLVNMITKRPTEQAFGEAYSTLGDGHKEVGADVGGPIDPEGKWLYRLTTKWQDGENSGDHTNDDRVYIAPALTWKPTSATSITLLADYNKRDSNTSHGIPLGSGLDPDTYFGEPDFDKMNTVEKNIGYDVQHDFGGGLKFRQTARFSDLELDYESVYLGTSSPTVSREAWAVYGHSRRFAIDSQLQYDTTFGDRVDSRTLLGTDVSWNKTEESRFYGTASGVGSLTNPVYCGLSCVTMPATGTDWVNEEFARGLYLQQELALDKQWILTVGGRFDVVETESETTTTTTHTLYDVSDHAFTKRIGLTYKATPELSLYANYSESFEPVAADRTSLVGTPKPQEGTQYEAGVKYRPAGTNALFTAAIFDLTQTNVPYYVSATTQSQIGEINVRGIELEGKAALSERVNITLAYALWQAEIVADGTDGNVGNRPQLVPKHLGSAWIDYTIPGNGAWGDLTVGVGARYTGDRFADNANTIKVDGYALLDAGATYKINDNMSLALNATNLLDKRAIAYVDSWSSTAYYTDSRAVKATLKVKW